MQPPVNIRNARVLFYKQELDSRGISTAATYKAIATWFNMSESYIEAVIKEMLRHDLSHIDWPYQKIDLKVIEMLTKEITKS